MSEIEGFDLDEFIPYRLNRASEWVSRGFSRAYREEFSMTRPEWRVLANLGKHQRLTAREIGLLSDQHKTKVSRAVFSLEQRKWLKRTQNPDDRREEWLELLPAGRKAFQIIAAKGREHDARLLGKLGGKNAEALLTALSALEEIQRG